MRHVFLVTVFLVWRFKSMRESFLLSAVLFVLIGSVLGPVAQVRADESDIVINEIMYNPADTNVGQEFVELYNRGDAEVDLSGWQLVDESQIMFTLPQGTQLLSHQYLVFYQNTAALSYYGLDPVHSYGPYVGGLSGSGERVQLKNANGAVIDEVHYDDASPWPTESDGNGPSLELLSPFLDNGQGPSWGVGQPYSPGVVNNPIQPGFVDGDIVINEIMYKPLKRRYFESLDPLSGGYYWNTGDDPGGEYIELFNRGEETVDLSNWRLYDDEGVLFEFVGTTIGPNSYLVVCANAVAIADRYNISNVVGDFNEGRLSNAGECIALRDNNGMLTDIVTYKDEPPWPIAPDQEGVSLECLDPLSDNAQPNNWRACRIGSGHATHKWQYVETTGQATSNRIYFYITGDGEWLIDQIVVTPAGGGTNMITDGFFEDGDDGWSKTGNHSGSVLTDEDSHDGTYCERIISTGVGGSSSNSLNQYIDGMITGQSYTISCWLKYLVGHESLTFRLSGDGLLTAVTADGLQQNEVPLNPSVGDEYFLNLGTAGVANSVSSNGPPPFVDVDEIKHLPKRPTSADAVTITAKVTSDNTITDVFLDYEVYVAPYQLPNQVESVAMYDDGLHGDGQANDGNYGVEIEPLGPQRLVRYRITATDNNGLSWSYPDEAEPNPNRAYFLSDREHDTRLPAYYLIIPKSSLDSLEADIGIREYFDATLVVDGIVYDHIGIHYRGRGWRSQPKRSWKVAFNKTEYLRGMSRLDLPSVYPTLQHAVNEIFLSIGQRNLGTEIVRLYRNGYVDGNYAFQFFGVYMAQESPNSSWLRKHGLDEDGEVFKASCAPDFGIWPNIPPSTPVADLDYYSNPALYPGMYEKKSDPLGSFDTLIELTDQVANTSDAVIFDTMLANVDLNDWLYRWAVQVCGSHLDIVGTNYFLIKPAEPDLKWQIHYFDTNLFFGCRCLDWWAGHTGCNYYDSDPYLFYNRFNWRCFNPELGNELNNRFLVILEDVLLNYMTVEYINALLDEAWEKTYADRMEEIATLPWLVGGDEFVVDQADLTRIKDFYAARHDWLVNTWLPSKSYTRPANAHPTIKLNDLAINPNVVEITWQYNDPEGDDCTVDLFWTDKKWSSLEPIPGAVNLPANACRFLWTENFPKDEYLGRGVYVHAIIRDNNSYLVGHDTTSNSFFVPTDCHQVWSSGLGLKEDLNRDCYLDLKDWAILAQDWLKCTDPQGQSCSDLTQQMAIAGIHGMEEGAVGIMADEIPVGALLWLKADAGVIEDATGVATWEDQSGNMNNAIRVKGTMELTTIDPPWEYDVIRFHKDGFFSLDTAPLSVPELSVYAVLEQTQEGRRCYFSNYTNIVNWGYGYTLDMEGPGARAFTSAGTPGSYSDWWIPGLDLGYHYITTTINRTSGTKSIYIDGNLLASASVPGMSYHATNRASIGTLGQLDIDSFFYQGDIAEIIVYPSVDTVQQASVEKYLREKYPHLGPPPQQCGDWSYYDADINEDCYVDMYDFVRLASQWLNSYGP
jgi:hypothetical protein